MIFNKHSDLDGQHAFLSPSKYHWVNYSEEKLIETYKKRVAALKGTELHDFACKCIQLGIRLSDTNKTLSMYVNDAIDYGLIPEQKLYYSEHAFGTADAISFNGKCLRIHDLKTGEGPVSMLQLQVEAALFCLEYNINPADIDIFLNIYQAGDIQSLEPDPTLIQKIMDTIVDFDLLISKTEAEEN